MDALEVASQIFTTLAWTAPLAVAATVLGDLVHASLHASLRLPAPLCWPGLLHRSHHRFLDERLRFHDDCFARQVLQHQLPELVMRVLFSAVLVALFAAPPAVLVVLTALWATSFFTAIIRRGHDNDHPEARPLPPPRAGIVVDGAYHALHHAHPEHFLGAHLGLVDIAFGRLLPLRGRTIMVVGGSGFCVDLVAHFRSAGADVAHLDVDTVVAGDHADVDILVLGHGSDRRDAQSYETLISRTLSMRTSVLPLDVWAVGHAPEWLARAGVFEDRVILRRLRRGPVLGVDRSLFFLRRGVRTF